MTVEELNSPMVDEGGSEEVGLDRAVEESIEDQSPEFQDLQRMAANLEGILAKFRSALGHLESLHMDVYEPGSRQLLANLIAQTNGTIADLESRIDKINEVILDNYEEPAPEI